MITDRRCIVARRVVRNGSPAQVNEVLSWYGWRASLARTPRRTSLASPSATHSQWGVDGGATAPLRADGPGRVVRGLLPGAAGVEARSSWVTALFELVEFGYDRSY